MEVFLAGIALFGAMLFPDTLSPTPSSPSRYCQCRVYDTPEVFTLQGLSWLLPLMEKGGFAPVNTLF